MTITFCDLSPIDIAIKNLKKENKIEKKKYGYIINCGGSPCIIADTILSNRQPRFFIKSSQNEDLNNIIGCDDFEENKAITARKYALDNNKPTEVIVLDFQNKSIDNWTDWIVE